MPIGVSKMQIGKSIAALLLLSTASLTLAQNQLPNEQTPSGYDKALAAGYKAQFTCSGLFNGDKDILDIQRDELTGIYGRVARVMSSLEAIIDFTDKHVRVDYGGAQPRFSVWNPNTGCTAMPIGWEAPIITGGIKIERPKPDRLLSGAVDDKNWPMGDQDATDAGIINEGPIGILSQKAFDSASYGTGKTSAIVVVHKGQIIAERYKKGHNLHTAQRTWSVAKSIGGTYVGYIAHKKGLDVNNSLNLWSNKNDPRNQISIDNAMRMTSGLYSDTAGNRTDPIYLGGSSVNERTTSWPSLYAPNTRYRYSNNDILLASMAVRKMAPELHPHQLFDKLGMTRTYAETDWHGNYLLSSQVWTTARDLARLGLLYIHGGIWPYGGKGSERLLPENWLEYVSNPTGPQPDSAFGYGATFWLMNNMQGIPKDAIAAQGNRGQYLVIIPSLDLIIVRRGYDTQTKRFNLQAFTRDIVAEL